MTTSAARAGCSYFGVRIPRHVRRDMADLAERGYTGVLHTFSENDFAYYRDTMAEIVAISHAAGLSVQASPWGLGRTFGGEAESRWVAFHPEECQVLDDGRRVAAACLNSAAYRDFCKEWADWVLECGVDSVFWDEPAWVVPVHVGVDDASRWTCRCERCAERFGGPIPAELVGGAGLPGGVGRRLPPRDARARRRARRLERDLPPALDRGHAGARRLERGRGAVRAWPPSSPIRTGSTGTARRRRSCGASPGCCARPPTGTGSRRSCGCRASGSRARTSPTSRRPSRPRARRASTTSGPGATRPAGHMTHLATPDSPLVWEAVSAALTGRPQTATTEVARRGSRRPRPPLDARPRAAPQRGGRDRSRRRRGSGRRARRRDRRDRRADAPRRTADLRRRRHVGSPRGARRGRVRPHFRLAARRGPRRRRRPGRRRGRSCCGDERTARVSPPARGLRRRRQRERLHAVRPRRARGRARGGCARRRRRRVPATARPQRWPSTRWRPSSGPR